MKLDFSKIEGWDTMTAEEKVAAIEEYDLNPSDHGLVDKKVLDKTASELVSKKRELKNHLTEEEVRKKEEEERQAERDAKYEALLRESTVNKMVAKYTSLGYSEDLAVETAEAYVDGDTDKVFENQKKAQTALEKKVRAEALADTPKPKGGGANNTMTKEKFDKMTSSERIAWAMNPDNEEAYKTMIGDNTDG